MNTERPVRLTARAASLLTAMLDHGGTMPPAHNTLLRQKLRNATICFSSDMPSGIVTLNSHVLYTVDGELAGPHLIVASEGDDFPDYALSIHDMRGLALLGLAEGQSISVEEDDIAPTMMTVVRVGMQAQVTPLPSTALRSRSTRVVAFAGRPEKPTSEFKPDDPGPRAA